MSYVTCFVFLLILTYVDHQTRSEFHFFSLFSELQSIDELNETLQQKNETQNIESINSMKRNKSYISDEITIIQHDEKKNHTAQRKFGFSEIIAGQLCFRF